MHELLAIIGIVMVIHAIWRLQQEQQRLREQEAQLVEEMLKAAPETVPVKVEIHHDCFYLFREDNDSFVAQGRDAEELIQNLRYRFQRINLDLVGGEPADLERLENELREAAPESISTQS